MMNAITFCEKCTGEVEFRSRSRIVIANVRDLRFVMARLINEHIARAVCISTCINDNNFLPGPERLWASLDDKIKQANEEGRLACLQGVNAVIRLWSDDCRRRFFEEARSRIDRENIRFLLFVSRGEDFVNDVFSNPRYRYSGMLLAFDVSVDENRASQRIDLVSIAYNKFPIPGVYISSLQQYIKEVENDSLQSDNVIVYVQFADRPFAGIDESIDQIYSERGFLQRYYGLPASDPFLSEEGIKWLFRKLSLSGRFESALAFVQRHFFPEGIGMNLQIESPVRITLSNGAEREVLVWMLRKTVDANSYLAKVLERDGFNEKQFVKEYVCAPLNLLSDEKRDAFISERKLALEKIGVELVSGEISNFVNRARELNIPNNQIIPWLNLGTIPEKVALIRRLHNEYDLNVSEGVLCAYPLLGDYLAPYQFENNLLNSYFTEYRSLKINNRITEQFCERAARVQLPIEGVRTRDELVKSYSGKTNAALLVVDALGAEYLPMILSMAKKRSLAIECARIAEVQLPTSTKFNSIDQWPADRRLAEIKELDTIIHNGAEIHSKKSFEENFVAQLNVFEAKVMPVVVQAMASYDTVVLTADHGSTRLAVSAYNEGLSQTLPFLNKEAIEDWRYARAITGKLPPPGLCSNLSGTYWVVNGYDRLPKAGGKLYEMHGGRTYEECLVPFVVFTNDSLPIAQPSKPQAPEVEFVENKDFDF